MSKHNLAVFALGYTRTNRNLVDSLARERKNLSLKRHSSSYIHSSIYGNFVDQRKSSGLPEDEPPLMSLKIFLLVKRLRKCRSPKCHEKGVYK